MRYIFKKIEYVFQWHYLLILLSAEHFHWLIIQTDSRCSRSTVLALYYWELLVFHEISLIGLCTLVFVAGIQILPIKPRIPACSLHLFLGYAKLFNIFTDCSWIHDISVLIMMQ